MRQVPIEGMRIGDAAWKAAQVEEARTFVAKLNETNLLYERIDER